MFHVKPTMDFYVQGDVSRETLQKEVKMAIKWLKREKTRRDQAVIENDLVKKTEVYYIPCNRIRANAMRSRCDFCEDKLISLAYSIKHYGVIEPLCVKETDDEDSYDFEIIAGERRLRAARIAGLLAVPCIIIDVEPQASAELSLIENIYSESLNYFEVAVALKRLLDLGDGSFEALASRLSIPQSVLLKRIWLLDLDYDERQALLNINCDEDIAVAIAKITDKSRRREMIDYISSSKADKSTASDYVELCARMRSDCGNTDIPRDVGSAIKGISSRIKLLNRHAERAKMNILRADGDVRIEISIKV